MLSPLELEQLLDTIPGGFKSSLNSFNKEKLKQIECMKLGVITNYEDGDDIGALNDGTEIYCNVPTCQLTFAGVAAYQTHFNSIHRYLCNECRRSFPTAHLLDLHLSEQHDCYFATSVARGTPMYACYLQECSRKMLTAKERKEHCINVHKFPANFRFDQINDKSKEEIIDSQRISKRISKPGEATKSKPFSFGHPKEKTFHMNKTHKSGGNRVESATKMETMDELQAALDAVL